MSAHSPIATDTDRQIDMGLSLASRACLAQIPALAQRRLGLYLDEIASLEAVADDGEGAQRLSRRLFGLLANAAVHCGGADTLRPLFDELSRLRVFLMLQAHLAVQVPESLMRGTPDLVANVDGAQVWIDTRARSAGVLADGGRPRLLVLDRSGMARRDPPLLMGTGYAAEYHLHDRRAGTRGEAGFELTCQSGPGECPGSVPMPPAALAAWLGQRHGRSSGRAGSL